MKLEHKGVKVNAPLEGPVDAAVLVEEVHEHGLAAADVAVQVQPADLRLVVLRPGVLVVDAEELGEDGQVHEQRPGARGGRVPGQVLVQSLQLLNHLNLVRVVLQLAQLDATLVDVEDGGGG